MNANEDDSRSERPLSAAERARLRELRSGPALPEGTEQAVIADLRAHGLLRARARGGQRVPAGLVVAAAVLVAGLAGLAGGLALRAPPAATGGVAGPPGERYLLLVHDPIGEPPLEHGELERRIAEYARWASSLGDALLGGAHLFDRVSLLRGEPGGNVTIERGGESLSSLGGYFLLATTSEDQAETIARSCPHLRHGGWLELRPLDERGGG